MTMVDLRAVELEAGDHTLAARVTSGDLQAFEQIMRRHNRMLYRTARSILRDDGEAEDCLQSAYLLAYRSMATFAGRSKLSTWLARIVINEALGRVRLSARRSGVTHFDAAANHDDVEQASIDVISEAPGPECEAMRRELGALIERRIDALPEVFRRVFILRAIEDLSVQETADLLGVPEATVRTRYFRARRLLRESLDQDVDTALDGAFAFAGARCARIVAAVFGRLGGRSPWPLEQS
jgi:RNA polymerase sigma-70 factor (ECF subfamily)